jgi:hypothetical protein
MARTNRLADAASSILTGVATLTLILGLLLTPNVVVADDSLIPTMPLPVAVCAGCTAACGGAIPCSGLAKKCAAGVANGCVDGNNVLCGCADAVTPGTCACEA